MLRHERENPAMGLEPDQKRGRLGAAATTLEAAMYQLREGGVEALKDPSCLRRLDGMSNGQLEEIVGTLKAIKSDHPKISKELIAYIAQLRRRKGND